MHILVISNLFPPYSIGGYEVACEEVVRSFRGHSVSILTTSYGLPAPAITGDVLRVLPNVFGDWPRGPLLWPRGWRRLFSPAVFEHSNRWIARIRPDLCYVWNLQALSLAPVVAARMRHIPIVYHFEDTWLPDTIYHPQPAIEGIKRFLGAPLAMRGATGAIFVSDFLRRAYSSRGFEFQRNTVVYNGVRVEPAARDQADEATLRLLFVGRVVPDKGLHVLIEAMIALGEDASRKPVLTVVGDGDERYLASLQRLAREQSLDVHWLGRAERQNVAPLYASHHVAVVPSVWDEPFGLVAIEAMAAGTPVVATCSGGLTEIVRPEVNGYLVPPGDAGALAQALKRFIDQPDLIRTLGARAHADVRLRFNLDQTTAAARRFVEQIAAG
jgi:glycogen synthase